MYWVNTEKYKTFSIPIEKKITTDKDGNESIATISCKINFIDSARFMATSLSNFVNNLTEVNVKSHKMKCEDCDFLFNMKLSRIV